MLFLCGVIYAFKLYLNIYSVIFSAKNYSSSTYICTPVKSHYCCPAYDGLKALKLLKCYRSWKLLTSQNILNNT